MVVLLGLLPWRPEVLQLAVLEFGLEPGRVLVLASVLAFPLGLVPWPGPVTKRPVEALQLLPRLYVPLPFLLQSNLRLR